MCSRELRFQGWRGVDLTVLLAVALLLSGVGLLLVRVSPVTVTWETASEVGTAGYNVYRAPYQPAVEDLSWHQVNPDLILAQGDEMVGARYRYEDHAVRPWRRYQYQIEEIEWDGGSTRYPHIVEVRAGLPVSWIRFEGWALVVLALALLWRKLKRSHTR